MTISKITKHDTRVITRRRIRYRSTWNIFNKITKGGFPNKTLNIALAGTGVGKSLFMCHMAGSSLVNGHNVLYITLEMAEERLRKGLMQIF